MLTYSFLLKFIKFGVVGFSGLLVDFGLTWVFKEKCKSNKYIANSIGFCVAASTNYILNRIWTFESENENITREYLSFFIISLAGLALNNFIIFLLNDKVKMHFYLSKLIAIIIVTIWNFGMNYFFTFS
jgi:putative flippase GtrA